MKNPLNKKSGEDSSRGQNIFLTGKFVTGDYPHQNKAPLKNKCGDGENTCPKVR